MSNYRRAITPGGCFFFTVVTYKRFKYFSSEANIQLLREAFHHVIKKHPFKIDAIVVLPDHLHTIWSLPVEDANYSLRWRLIKHFVSSRIKTDTNHRNEKQVWQRRYWEHEIKDDHDWRKHLDYIHYNPVKHRYARKPADWKYSSFNQAVSKGWYDENWGQSVPLGIANMNLE